jgi:hypothetical protein
MADINNDPELADKPEWFKRIIAGVGDVISMINNAAANNFYLRTAFTRQALIELCYLIDYVIPDATTASGRVIFHLNPAKVVFPLTLTKDQLVATGKSSGAVNSRRYESRTDVVNYALISIDSPNNQITDSKLLVSRVFDTGEKVRIYGVVPVGLTTDTDYFVLKVDDTHIRLCKSIEDLKIGKFIVITPPTPTPGTCQIRVYSVTVTCFQQETKTDVLVGTSDGIKEWQEYDMTDVDILIDTMTITIGGDPWEQVESLTFSQRADRHYQVIRLNDRKCYVRFGNGEYGLIPPNFPIIANYCIGGGLNSNVLSLGGVANYAGESEVINGVFNCDNMEGGSDPQSMEMVKRIAPGTIKSRDRFITEEDGEFLAVQFGGVIQARCIRNAYGVLTAKMVCIAAGGGQLDAAHKIALKEYLESRTIMESITVYVEDAKITPQNLVMSVKLYNGYQWSDVLPFIRLAYKLLMADSGREILDEFLSLGVDRATDKINHNFNEVFGPADYVQMQSLLDNLNRYGVREFGDRIDQSEVISFIQSNIRSIDWMTISSPTFPITCAADEITTYGTINITQVL